MMRDQPSETSPLLRATDGSLSPDDVEDNPGTAIERQDSVDEFRTAQFTGNPEMEKRLKLYIFPAVSIGVFLVAADQTIIATICGKIGSELEALNLTSWIATSYFLSLTSFQPLYGKLSDIFGRKPCLLFAYVVFGIGSLLCGLSRDIYQLICARVIQGIGGGGMTTVVSILLSDIVPLKNRGVWQGIVNIVYAAGAAMGAPLGGILTDTVGWRWAFVVQAPLCAVSIVAVSIMLEVPVEGEQKWREKLGRVDFLGALALVMSVLGLILGLDRGSNESWSMPISYVPIVASIVFFGLFIFIEMKVSKEPLAPGYVVFDPNLFAGYLCNFFSMGGWLAVYYYIPLFYQALDGLSVTAASLKLLPAIISSVSGALFGGFYIKRTGKIYWLTVVAYILMVYGTLLITLFSGGLVRNNWIIALGLVMGSFGNGIGLTSSLIAIISNAGPENQALATACSYLFRQLGSVIGISTSASVIQLRLQYSLKKELGSGKDAERIEKEVRRSLDVLKSLPHGVQILVRNAYGDAIRHGFMLMVGISLGAVVASFFIKEKRLSRND